MFSKIDNFLIMWAQWFVRQIELYTNRTKKCSIVLFLNFNSIFTFVLILLCVLYFNFDEKSILIKLLSIGFCFMINIYNRSLKEKVGILSDSNSTNSLPEEIVTRFFLRILLLLVCCLTMFQYFLAYTNLTGINIYDRIIIVSATSQVYIVVLVEYLLCTTSLPPGEKERKQIEKEMSSLVPIKIRN